MVIKVLKTNDDGFIVSYENAKTNQKANGSNYFEVPNEFLELFQKNHQNFKIENKSIVYVEAVQKISNLKIKAMKNSLASLLNTRNILKDEGISTEEFDEEIENLKIQIEDSQE